MYMYILFHILFHYSSLQILNVVPCAVCIVVCFCKSQTPKLSLFHLFPFCNSKFVFYVCESFSAL